MRSLGTILIDNMVTHSTHLLNCYPAKSIAESANLYTTLFELYGVFIIGVVRLSMWPPAETFVVIV